MLLLQYTNKPNQYPTNPKLTHYIINQNHWTRNKSLQISKLINNIGHHLAIEIDGIKSQHRGPDIPLWHFPSLEQSRKPLLLWAHAYICARRYHVLLGGPAFPLKGEKWIQTTFLSASLDWKTGTVSQLTKGPSCLSHKEDLWIWQDLRNLRTMCTGIMWALRRQ